MQMNAETRDQIMRLLREFKGESYTHGVGCLGQLGALASAFGKRACVITSGVGRSWGAPIHETTQKSLRAAGVKLSGPPIRGARPNAPHEDVLRIVEELRAEQPDVAVAVGGGSTIDAAKAAVAYLALGDLHRDLHEYYGVGEVSRMLHATGRKLLPIVAVQLAAGSAAHLTKYANVTYAEHGQKMLIVDDAIVPPASVFDYSTIKTMSNDFLSDGALDAVAHCHEVYMGIPDDKRAQTRPVSLLGIEAVVNHLERACADPDDMDAREAIGLGSDLGGYAIMLGGTNGAHLTSFSLIDILSHGRACALLNPYYTVFFAPAVEDKLREVGRVYRDAGYLDTDLERLNGRDVGLAIAEAMLTLSDRIGFPKTLSEVPGFTDAHIERAIAAAKNPKLEMKLRNMPVPLTADGIDAYMRPVLEAAKTGDFKLIKNMPI